MLWKKAIHYIIILFFSLYHFGGCRETQETFKSMKEIDEKIELKFNKKINLFVGNGPTIGSVGGIIVSDNSFIVVDNVKNEIYKYDSSGKYLKTIGKKGEDLGEYLKPMAHAIAVDQSENILVYDAGSGKLNLYNKEGKFISDLNSDLRLGYFDKFLLDKGDHLLQLTQDKNGIAFLRKFNGHNLKNIFEVKLSNREIDSIIIHMSLYSGFVYNKFLDRIYYIVPIGYMINEIDAETGDIIRKFGKKPSNYRPLNKKYHELGFLKNPSEMVSIMNRTTFLFAGFFLLNDQYLLLGYANDGDVKATWIIFDINNINKPISFEKKSEEILSYNTRRLCAVRDDLLYTYSEPIEEEFEESNGYIEEYTFISYTEQMDK